MSCNASTYSEGTGEKRISMSRREEQAEVHDTSIDGKCTSGARAEASFTGFLDVVRSLLEGWVSMSWTEKHAVMHSTSTYGKGAGGARLQIFEMASLM